MHLPMNPQRWARIRHNIKYPPTLPICRNTRWDLEDYIEELENLMLEGLEEIEADLDGQLGGMDALETVANLKKKVIIKR